MTHPSSFRRADLNYWASEMVQPIRIKFSYPRNGMPNFHLLSMMTRRSPGIDSSGAAYLQSCQRTEVRHNSFYYLRGSVFLLIFFELFSTEAYPQD